MTSTEMYHEGTKNTKDTELVLYNIFFVVFVPFVSS
jgi:hypothetical protein